MEMLLMKNKLILTNTHFKTDLELRILFEFRLINFS